MSEITDQIAKIKEQLTEIEAEQHTLLRLLPNEDGNFIPGGGMPTKLALLDERARELRKKLAELEKA
jgi:hypothetical protein